MKELKSRKKDVDKIIQELLEEHFVIHIYWNPKRSKICYNILGFYDRGDFSFYDYGDHLSGQHKEGIEENFYTLEDFVSYNYHCWKTYIESDYCTDNIPDYRWKSLLIKFGYISEEVIPKTIYKGLK